MTRNMNKHHSHSSSRPGPSRRDMLRYLGGLALAVPASGVFGELLLGSEASQRNTDNLALRFAKYYRPVPIKGKPKVPAYPLPLDLKKVANFEQTAAALGVATDEPSLLNNGFVVLPGKRNEDIVQPYKDLKKREVPIFITADTLLHLYHVQFDETLKEIEEREFYKDITALAQTLAAELAAMELPARDDDFRQAHHKALTFFAIGLKCLQPEAKLPGGVNPKEVEQVLDKMRKHEGFWPDPNREDPHETWPLFRYSEDFSQYVPRGHYTRSEILKKYFVAMMWFGRMTFLIKGDASHGVSTRFPALVSVAESNQQTIAAAMITKLLDQTKLSGGRKAYDVWERIYTVTSFYVGLADDLGIGEYRSAFAKVCGSALDLAALADEHKLTAFKVELARFQPPAIYSGTGMQSAPEYASPGELLKFLDKSMGFRLMGQRFIPDSYMMGKLVWPTVGEPTREGIFTRVETPGGPIRGFPRGLDVMTILGSARAREILHELGDDAYSARPNNLTYDQALANLQKEYGKLRNEDWNRNLYWSWLYALKPLLAEYGAGYPTFMTTQAYRTRLLNAALASWAQLRHDTILYAKQSYTGIREVSNRPLPEPVQGYVEPLPEFYARLLALARMTNQGLTEMKVLDEASKGRLDEFEKLLERLLAIAEKELADQKLTEDDYEFIRNFGEQLEKVSVVPDPKAHQELFVETSAAMKTTLIADVHTDQNSQKVLEEGTGYVDLGVFIYGQPDGRMVMGAGPVLSYYEFKHPMADRLTDEKWRQLLQSKVAPEPPEWTQAYLSRQGRYVCSA